jgi:membrane protein DedA with SNARE-associated domain
MAEEILKAASVVLISTVKFFLGPLAGYNLKLHPVITALSTILGMMISVTAFTYFGEWLKNRVFRKFFNKSSKPSNRRRKFTILLRKYGLGSVAFCTPLILTPIGGTLIAVSMGKPREKILLYMFISSILWSILFTFLLYSYGEIVIDFFKRVWPF